MEEDQNTTKSHTLPLTPVVINELLGAKENMPTPPRKIRKIPWIIIGIIISIIIVGIGLLVWKIIQSQNSPDITVTAPDKNSTVYTIPTPTDSTVKITTQEVPFEPSPYRNDLANFEIKVPLGWQIDDSGKSNAVVVLIDPKATVASGSALITLVSVSTGPSSHTLADEVKDAKEGLKKLFKDYTFEEDKQMVISGKMYYLLGGSYNVKNTKMRNRNLIHINNNRGYAVSATAPDSVWPKKEIMLNATLFSFKTL